MPMYSFNIKDSRIISEFLCNIIAFSQEVVVSLRSALQIAWFGPPKPNTPKKDLSFIDTVFWQNTEAQFYSILESFISNLHYDHYKNRLLDEWSQILQDESIALFDSNALAQQEDGLNMKRIVSARKGLEKGFAKMNTNIKELKGGDE